METAEDKEVEIKVYCHAQLDWLTGRFPEGKYTDVGGLCKMAKLDGENGVRD